MSNLNNRSALHPRWAKHALGALAAFESCVIAIFDPRNRDDGPQFDPYAKGATANATMVGELLWTGTAQMQLVGKSLTMDDVAGSVTNLRTTRFTVDIDEAQVYIQKGTIIRIISCPHDPMQENWEYVVTSSANSGLAFKRTFEAETDMAVLGRPVTEFD